MRSLIAKIKSPLRRPRPPPTQPSPALPTVELVANGPESGRTNNNEHVDPTTVPGETTIETLSDTNSSPNAELPTLQIRLWNAAYDTVKEADQKLIDTYERILSSKLKEIELGTNTESTATNNVAQDGDVRWAQMQTLAKHGLEQTEKAASIADKTTQGLQVISTVKGVVNSALQSVPQAAIAWASVCLGLEVSHFAAIHLIRA